ncbi:hypothetical protein DACRYDRAFT_119454 [Dacryopinax primogenitus]|uniref:Secreted protein n=1 Tax=Dacryopinax primogenitus (strain DJM 731) TaxID=1858805 RepID=M5FNF1_DACPD|nr:uncharacterized protein DACRYDRAFT_119454 [Dacryopinax primogenitus]EJT97335.1 hypothetical protein DACRYDRAFT_119454 [Dacryopinax primogenitus]
MLAALFLVSLAAISVVQSSTFPSGCAPPTCRALSTSPGCILLPTSALPNQPGYRGAKLSSLPRLRGTVPRRSHMGGMRCAGLCDEVGGLCGECACYQSGYEWGRVSRYIHWTGYLPRVHSHYPPARPAHWRPAPITDLQAAPTRSSHTASPVSPPLPTCCSPGTHLSSPISRGTTLASSTIMKIRYLSR